MEFDLVIRNGKIVSGAGNPWFRGDVGIRGDRIAVVGDLSSASAQRVIEAKRFVVTPGFIDSHAHSALKLIENPQAEPKITQGVTTEVIGVDGFSIAPTSEDTVELLVRFLAGIEGETKSRWSWSTLGEYFEIVETRGISINLASYVGNGTVRLAAVGFENRPATEEEMETMKSLVARSMEEGAFGLSSGLIYPLSMYADKKELIELCRVAAWYEGSYVTHIRGEGDTLLESIHEALEIGEASGIPIHISHLKSRGRANWGKAEEALDMIDVARSKMMDVTADQYPYKAGSSTLTSLLPPWVLEGGNERLLERLRKPGLRQRIKRELETGLPGWEGGMRDIGWGNVRVSYCRKNEDLEGKSLEEIAQMRGVDAAEALFDLLIEEDAVASMVIFHMSEEDVRTIMRHPAVNVCTDGLILGKPHPRLYGSFARVLGRYVREERVLTLEEAVRKMTSLPAQRLGLADRGFIAEGMYADITVFDSKSVIDRATYDDPQLHPEGIMYVIVNGVVTVDDGEHTGAMAGRVLRRGGLGEEI